MGKNAVIIGGSLSGLMHAIMLRHHGYDVTVLEADPSRTRGSQAAGIGAGPEVVAWLKQHDRTGRDYAVYSPSMLIVDHEFKARFNPKREHMLTNWGLLESIMRENFDGKAGALRAAEGEGKAVFREGMVVKGVQENGDKVVVLYEDVSSGGGAAGPKVLEMEVDLVIAADGANSTVRRLLVPSAKRKYVGYVTWRGTVPEEKVSERTRKLIGNFVVAHAVNKSYIIIYVMPTDDGCVKEGSRLLNWVWYCNIPENSAELASVLTDINGKRHFGTVPRGMVRPEVREKQKAIGIEFMPAPHAELIQKTETPFVTSITEVLSDKATFFNNKLYLVGDALAGFRPHVGMSTNQAAMHCRLLEEVIENRITPAQWAKQVLRWGRATAMKSTVVGTFSLASRTVFLFNLVKCILLIIGQK